MLDRTCWPGRSMSLGSGLSAKKDPFDLLSCSTTTGLEVERSSEEGPPPFCALVYTSGWQREQVADGMAR